MTLYPRARFDAARAAAILTANGSALPDGIADAAGFDAYLHPDRATGDTWREQLTQIHGITLIGFDVIEGGWLYLYDTQADTRTPQPRRPR